MAYQAQYITLLMDAMLCVMCADKDVDRSEIRAICLILKGMRVPLTRRDVESHIRDFLRNVNKIGIQEVIGRTVEQSRNVHLSSKERNIILHCIRRVMLADGRIDPSESEVFRKFQTALERSVDFDVDKEVRAWAETHESSESQPDSADPGPECLHSQPNADSGKHSEEPNNRDSHESACSHSLAVRIRELSTREGGKTLLLLWLLLFCLALQYSPAILRALGLSVGPVSARVILGIPLLLIFGFSIQIVVCLRNAGEGIKTRKRELIGLICVLVIVKCCLVVLGSLGFPAGGVFTWALSVGFVSVVILMYYYPFIGQLACIGLGVLCLIGAIYFGIGSLVYHPKYCYHCSRRATHSESGTYLDGGQRISVDVWLCDAHRGQLPESIPEGYDPSRAGVPCFIGVLLMMLGIVLLKTGVADPGQMLKTFVDSWQSSGDPLSDMKKWNRRNWGN